MADAVRRLAPTKSTRDFAEDDAEERAEVIDEIIAHLDALRSGGARKHAEMKRDSLGRRYCIDQGKRIKCDPEHAAREVHEAHQHIQGLRAQPHLITDEAREALAKRLSGLTLDQLHELKRKLGLKASGLKSTVRDQVANRSLLEPGHPKGPKLEGKAAEAPASSALGPLRDLATEAAGRLKYDGDLVDLTALRKQIRATHGDEAASDAAMHDAVIALWKEGLFIPVQNSGPSNTFTGADIKEAVPGRGAEGAHGYAWLQPAGKASNLPKEVAKGEAGREGGKPAVAPGAPEKAPDAAQGKVASAVDALLADHPTGLVPIAAIMKKSGLSKEEAHKALLDMHNRGEIGLTQASDRGRLTPEEHAASIRGVTGHPYAWASPRPPQPGFTGKDGKGREWERGELKLKGPRPLISEGERALVAAELKKQRMGDEEIGRHLANLGPTPGHLSKLAGAFAAHKGAKHNLVSLADLKDATGLSVPELHAAVNHLRREGVLTGSGAEGRHGIGARERAAAIPGRDGEHPVANVSVREGQEGAFRELAGKNAPAREKPGPAPAPKARPAKAAAPRDAMAGHPLAGKSREEIIRHLGEVAYAGHRDVNPWKLKAEDGAGLVPEVVSAVKDAQAKNSFDRPSIPRLYAAVRGKHPDLTLRDFQQSLLAGYEQGQLRLDPYTGSLGAASDEDMRHMFPLDREKKFYVDLKEPPGAQKHAERAGDFEAFCMEGENAHKPGVCPGPEGGKQAAPAKEKKTKQGGEKPNNKGADDAYQAHLASLPVVDLLARRKLAAKGHARAGTGESAAVLEELNRAAGERGIRPVEVAPVDAAAHRPSKPEERHPDAAPEARPWKAPPPKRGKKGEGMPARPRGDESQTVIGDRGEELAEQLGFRSILPPGQRSHRPGEVKEKGSTIDTEMDHSGRFYELKLCNDSATEYRLKAKRQEKEDKLHFAEQHQGEVYTLVAVREVESGAVHFYGSKKPGLIGAEVSEKHFDFLGTVRL